jgi:hypothetical protein
LGILCLAIALTGCTDSKDSDAAPDRSASPATPAESRPTSGVGAWVPWVDIAPAKVGNKLLIFPERVTNDPADRCFVRYTSLVVSQNASRAVIALVQQSPVPEPPCVGAAVLGSPVIVRLHPPFAGERLVDAATGRTRKLAPAGAFAQGRSTQPAHPSQDYSKELGFVPAPNDAG